MMYMSIGHRFTVSVRENTFCAYLKAALKEINK